MKKKFEILFVTVVIIGVIGVFFWRGKTEGNGQECREVKVETVETVIPDTELYIEDASGDREADGKTEEDKKGEEETPVSDTELYMDTYEDLERNPVIETGGGKETEEEEGSSDTDSEKKTKVTVIDESEETMRDETKGTEKEYDAKEEPQGKIELHEVKEKEGGKEVNGDVPASGKHVGTWG